MGHTNSTANLSLPQFIGTDKPTWLGDVNGAFSAIDSYAGTNDAAVAAAVSDASSAISQAAAAVNTANTANTTAGNASTAANNAIGVANTANAIAGTVDTKVGLLADLHTTDRTSIVNAINEIADAPATSGITLLWTNADPSSNFSSQNIILSSADYDLLVFTYKNIATADAGMSQIINKGSNLFMQQVNYFSSNTHAIIRYGTRVDDTTYTITDCEDNGTTANNYNIPVKVYGIKL